MGIDQNDFRAWKDDRVTKEVFKALKEARELINESLTNSDIVLGEGSVKAIPRLIGQREGLDLVLEMSCNDLEEEESHEN